MCHNLLDDKKPLLFYKRGFLSNTFRSIVSFNSPHGNLRGLHSLFSKNLLFHAEQFNATIFGPALFRFIGRDGTIFAKGLQDNPIGLYTVFDFEI